MKGICINAADSLVLKEGQEYYLFEHGTNNYYVSKFDDINAHCGSYQRKCFKLIEEKIFDQSINKRYLAKVAIPRNGYRMGEQYIISQPNDKKYFTVWLIDRPNSAPVGSYINNFFEVIEPYKEPHQNTPVTIATPTKMENQAKKNRKRKIEQISIFDFI